MIRNNPLKRFLKSGLSFICKVDDIIAGTEKIILAMVLSSIIIVLLIQIVMRNFFDTGLFEAEIIIRHLILSICFIGASLTTYYRRHIKIDIISRLVSEKINNIILVFNNFFCAVICVWLAKAGRTFLIDEIEYGGSLTSNIPLWIFMVVIPVSFSIMAFRFILNIFKKNFSGEM